MFKKFLVAVLALVVLLSLFLAGDKGQQAEANVIACTPTLTVARFYESAGLVMVGYNIMVNCSYPVESTMVTGAFQRLVFVRYSTMGGSVSTMLCGGVPYCAVQWSNYLSPGLYRVSSETIIFHEGREWGPYRNFLYFRIDSSLAVVPITGTTGPSIEFGENEIVIADPSNVSLDYNLSNPCATPWRGVIQFVDNSQSEDRYTLFFSRWEGSSWAFKYVYEMGPVQGIGNVATVPHNFDPNLSGWWRVGVQAGLLGVSASNIINSNSLAMPYGGGCATLVQPSNVVLGPAQLGGFVHGSWTDNSSGEDAYHVDLFYWSGAWYLYSQYDLPANTTSADMVAGAGSTWYYFNVMASAGGTYGPVGTSNMFAP